MRNLERQYGPIRHIVLGTVALEHKATFGPFAQNFPKAQVWIQPGQWSFPLNLPLVPALGVVQRNTRLLLSQQQQDPPEWVADLEYEILEPLRFKSVGAFSETAFFHKSTQTLLVTDAVVSVTPDPPPIIQVCFTTKSLEFLYIIIFLFDFITLATTRILLNFLLLLPTISSSVSQ